MNRAQLLDCFVFLIAHWKFNAMNAEICGNTWKWNLKITKHHSPWKGYHIWHIFKIHISGRQLLRPVMQTPATRDEAVDELTDKSFAQHMKDAKMLWDGPGNHLLRGCFFIKEMWPGHFPIQREVIKFRSVLCEYLSNCMDLSRYHQVRSKLRVCYVLLG